MKVLMRILLRLLNFLQNFDRIQRPLRSFLMFEKAVHISPMLQMFTNTADHTAALIWSVFRFAIAVVTKISGDYVGCDSLFCFGHTDGAIVFCQKSEGVVC